jgi:hypothetical protein
VLDTRWDAAFADFRRFYQMDLRAALTEIPARDLMALIRKLPEDSALVREETGPWGSWDARENTARLLEVMSYLLDLEWTDRISDPEDRELKREQAAAKRAGLKPPERPIVPPVAMRPQELAEERFEKYAVDMASYQVKANPKPQQSTRASFEASWGIDS